MPKYWYDWNACEISEDDGPDTIEDKKFNRRILADKKPYFMSYIYPVQMRKYRQYMKKIKSKSIMQFESELCEIVAKQEPTAEERTFADYYFYRVPMGIEVCVMNRICWMIEDEMEGYKFGGGKLPTFDYEILKSGCGYSKNAYYKVADIGKIYAAEAAAKHKAMAEHRISDQEYITEREIFLDRFRRQSELACTSEAELCDIVVDMCYKRKCTRSFAWRMCGDVIIKNLLAKKCGIHVIVKDTCGDIDYCGEKYRLDWIDMNKAEEKKEAEAKD